MLVFFIYFKSRFRSGWDYGYNIVLWLRFIRNNNERYGIFIIMTIYQRGMINGYFEIGILLI